MFKVTKKIQTETKLGRFTVSFLLHICEEKDENEEFDFKLSLKSNNRRRKWFFTLPCFVHPPLHIIKF